MLKKMLIGGGAAAALGTFVFGTSAFSYLHTGVTEVREAVRAEVPLDFEIARARQEIEKIAPEIEQCMHVIAEQQYDIEQREADIARREAAGLSGPLAGRLTFALNGTLEGRRSVEEGFNSQDTPIFLQAGIDTTINQLSVIEDDPTTILDERLAADTTQVPIYNYAISRGKCDEFENAGADGIQGADAEKIQASLANGILTIRVPKSEAAKPRRISVQAQ